MLKIGRIPAALFFAANFFALAVGANPQNAHSPTAPFVDSAQIFKAGSKIREESARDALSSGLPSLAQLIIEDGEKDGGGQIGTDEILVYVDSLIAQGKFEKALRRILPIAESAPTPENKIRVALAYIGLGEAGNAEEAMMYSRKARNWSFWGIALCVLFWIAYVALIVAGVSWATWWDSGNNFYAGCLF